MRYLILIFLISLNSYAIDWNFKYSGFTEIKKLNFNSNDEAINFNNYGTWEDSLGNYGEGKCQGMSTIEDNQNDMKFYCEYVDQDNEKMSLMNLNVDLYRHWALTESTDLLFALGFGYMSTTLEDEGGNETEMSGIFWAKNIMSESSFAAISQPLFFAFGGITLAKNAN